MHQSELPGMSGPKLYARTLRNARWCRNHAQYWLKRGDKKQFHTWMLVAHRSIQSARRLSQSGIATVGAR